MNIAPIAHYDDETDVAVYHASEIVYMTDAGVFIACPNCGASTSLSTAVDAGCWPHNCGRGPWGVKIQQ